jgi:hypothetical protein
MGHARHRLWLKPQATTKQVCSSTLPEAHPQSALADFNTVAGGFNRWRRGRSPARFSSTRPDQ